MKAHVMSAHVVLWLHLGAIVILAGHQRLESPEPAPGPGLAGQRGTNTSGGLGRYSIDRVILEGAGPPEHSQAGPYFDLSLSGNVSVVTGDLASLNCRVHNLGNRTVSWIRLANLSLLTVGRYTYTSDLRFEGIHSKHSADWRLALKGARLTDTGLYECQVSTTPHMAHTVHLSVRDPVTTLLGGPEMFVESSSMINLTCLVSWTAGPPDKVLWFHNGTEVTYNGPRPGVSLIVDKSEVTTVTLLLQLASALDSGTYHCRPDNAPPASIAVHVLSGDKTAQLSAAPSLWPTQAPLLLLLLPDILVRSPVRW